MLETIYSNFYPRILIKLGYKTFEFLNYFLNNQKYTVNRKKDNNASHVYAKYIFTKCNENLSNFSLISIGFSSVSSVKIFALLSERCKSFFSPTRTRKYSTSGADFSRFLRDIRTFPWTELLWQWAIKNPANEHPHVYERFNRKSRGSPAVKPHVVDA